MHKETQLSTEDLAGLRAIEQHYSDNQQSTAVLTKRTFMGYLATAMCTALVAVLLWVAWMPDVDKTEQIFADVANNHLSYKTLKYNTESLVELGDKFSYLGFMLSKSGPMQAIKGALSGARPCLILNIPAAQLRYQTKDKRWSTVFQTRYEKSIHGIVPDISHQAPLVAVKNGIRISVWKEHGLLFAMAQP